MEDEKNLDLTQAEETDDILYISDSNEIKDGTSTESIQEFQDNSEKYESISSGLKKNLKRLSELALNLNKQMFLTRSTLDPLGDSLAGLGQRMIESAARAVKAVSLSATASPLIEALRNISIDYSAIIKGLSIVYNISNSIDKLRDIHLQALYDAKWFPYMILFTDIEVVVEINDIIGSTRTGSKSREKKIDKVFLSFFTDKNLKEIKSEIWHMDIPHWQKRAISHAINAHLRKEYILTISCLAPMWEQLFSQRLFIKKIHKDKFNEKYKSNIKVLFSENGFNEVLADFYNRMIISQCNAPEEVVEGIPNRHGIAHGWYNKYPNQKASLNAILLTYFLLKLEPKNQLEDFRKWTTENADGEQGK